MANTPITDTVTKLELQIEALESRNAFQDDIIEQLNQELAVHQAQISDLKQQLTLIANRIKDSNNHQTDKQEVEPPPPHY
ncbi:SlyX family protein [Colwelliaceae bacterium 6471]